MQGLPKPAQDVGSVIDALEAGHHFDEVKAIRAELIAGEAEFRMNVSASSAASTARGHVGVSEIDERHVRWVWERQFSGRKGKAGQLYDRILNTAIEGLCPICGKREADEIDHHLPKNKYPRLSIVPLNMVPICHKCNNIKRTFTASVPSEEPFHPYFDNLGSARWLVAESLPQTGVPLKFSIVPDATWSADLAGRVEFWFSRLRLGALYTRSAGGILSGMQLLLEREEITGGARAIRALLLSTAESWEHSGTSAWLSASYRGWAKSTYFCEGGWRL